MWNISLQIVLIAPFSGCHTQRKCSIFWCVIYNLFGSWVLLDFAQVCVFSTYVFYSHNNCFQYRHHHTIVIITNARLSLYIDIAKSEVNHIQRAKISLIIFHSVVFFVFQPLIAITTMATTAAKITIELSSKNIFAWIAISSICWKQKQATTKIHSSQRKMSKLLLSCVLFLLELRISRVIKHRYSFITKLFTTICTD